MFCGEWEKGVWGLTGTSATSLVAPWMLLTLQCFPFIQAIIAIGTSYNGTVGSWHDLVSMANDLMTYVMI